MREKIIAHGGKDLCCAAILEIYAAGYEQTKAAADLLTEQTAQRLTNFPAVITRALRRHLPARRLRRLPARTFTAERASIKSSHRN